MLDSRFFRSSCWSRSITGLVLLSGLAVAALLAPVRTARALSLEVTVAQPAGVAVGDAVTLTVSLDQMITFNGYELFVSWDPTELQFNSARQLLVTPLLDFTVPIPATIDPVELRLTRLLTSPSPGKDLFSVDFDLLSLVDDGQVDFRVFAKVSATSTGLSGTPIPVLDNPQGIEVLARPGGLVVVPEPRSVVLLAAALVVTAGLRRRRRG